MKRFRSVYINEFIELGKPVTNAVRLKIQELLLEGSSLSHDEKTIEECFYDLDKIQMMMPLHVQNYTDFLQQYRTRYQCGENVS